MCVHVCAVCPPGRSLVALYRDVCLGIYPNLPKLFSIACMPRTPFAVIPTPDAQAAAAPAAYYLGGAGDGTRPGTFFVNTSRLQDRRTCVGASTVTRGLVALYSKHRHFNVLPCA